MIVAGTKQNIPLSFLSLFSLFLNTLQKAERFRVRFFARRNLKAADAASKFEGTQPPRAPYRAHLRLRRIFWPAEPVKKWISLFPAFAKAGTLRGFPQTRRRVPPPAGSGAPYNHTGLPSPKLGSRGSPTTKSAGAFAPGLLVLF